jgi:hypothetical protein
MMRSMLPTGIRFKRKLGFREDVVPEAQVCITRNTPRTSLSPGPIGLYDRSYAEFPRRPLLGNLVNRDEA